MAQLNHGVHVALPRIQLAHHLSDSLHISRRVGDHQRIGRHRRADIAINRYQRPDQPANISGAAGIQLDDPGDELRRRGVFCRTVAGAGFGFGHRRDQNPVTFVDHREVMGVEH
ncbi:hypothetical protein D3C73_616410 [compost metagenome]